MEATIILRYDEIGLKGGNRGFFEEALVRHVRAMTAGKPGIKIGRIRGRILVDGEHAVLQPLCALLALVPGICSLSLGRRMGMALEDWKAAALELVREACNDGRPRTFRISTNRSDKGFPMTSNAINVAVGAHVLAGLGAGLLKVRLEEPDIDVGLDIHEKAAVMFRGSQRGPGGLPVGTAGRLLCLLSGGIDSPVAAYQLIRRGCKVDFVFFENKVFSGRAAFHKVRQLAAILARYQMGSRLFVVPFSDIQIAVRDNCSPRNRVVHYRRFMYRIAEKVMNQQGALGLVTGESLGQVASQTLENLAAVDDVVSCPVYRPLIGTDKLDIQVLARRIGTFETSIIDAPDCCSIFMPKRPATRSKLDILRRDEAILDLQGLEDQAIATMEVVDLAAEF